MQQELFLYDEVLHMSVDNLVERTGRGRVNSAKFNTMMRIAQFWCNAPGRRQESGKNIGASDKDHRVVGRKAQFFGGREFLEWKTFAN
ncbi:MAG TPA: hypothetical protein VFI45_19335 [Candidatus Acidoferrum sp.]|nr:hypothetical protein [Candidatus Acidoferrum sp.]